MDHGGSFLALIAALLLAACGGQGGWKVSFDEPLDPAVTRGWTVTDVAVQVPEALTVSDANQLAPNADIVWHGDPAGDRRAQVSRILDAGITAGTRGLDGGHAVRVEAELLSFHGVTPLAISRAPAAVHNISFAVRVVDARSGAVLVPRQVVHADLRANVGGEAVLAAQRGETEKVRITAHLARVTRGWLGLGPDPRGSFSSPGR